MTAITLESDSSHSPPVIYKSNDRSSQKSPKNQWFLLQRGGFLRVFSQFWRIIPRPQRQEESEHAPELRSYGLCRRLLEIIGARSR